MRRRGNLISAIFTYIYLTPFVHLLANAKRALPSLRLYDISLTGALVAATILINSKTKT